MTAHQIRVAVASCIVCAFIAGVVPGVQTPTSGAGPTSVCSDGVGAAGEYTLTTCITIPDSNAVLSGVQTVVATAKITQAGTAVRMNDIAFCLDADRCDSNPAPDNYLLTAYQPTIAGDGTRSYSFQLDTALWPDGHHILFAVPVTNRDTLKSASISLTFDNGSTGAPVLPSGFAPTQGSLPPIGQSFTIAAVGDGAGGEAGEARVSSMIAGWQPNMFLYLGDVYAKGSIAEFDNHYDGGGYGQFAAITNPAIGNHEYSADPTADGYFRYWKSPPDHYSVDAAGWHIISLNSTAQYNKTLQLGQDSKANPDPDSQYNWLKADLEAHPDSCTVVTYHHPVFNTGSQSKVGFDPDSENGNYFQDIWELLADAQVSLVLNGHDHNYQRFVPIGRDGLASATGVTEIVVGGGGHAVSTPAILNMGTDGSMLAASGTFYGALRLTPHADRMDFSVGNADSGDVYDTGSVPCQALGPDTVAPAAPATITATATNSSTGHPQVDLAWTLASVADDRGVAQFRIRRDDSAAVLATVASPALSWSDETVQIGSSHTYTVTAVDAWGNESAPVTSGPASSAVLPTTNLATADTYVSSASPSMTYGTANPVRVGTSTSTTTRSYFKFDLTREQPVIVKALLRVLPTSSASNATITPHAVSSAWSEARTGADAISWSNAPPLGAAAPGVKGYSTGTWATFDVSSLVQTNGVVSIALSEDTAGTSVAVSAREGGQAVTAQLIVTSVAAPDTVAPSVPTNVTATAPTDAESPVEVTWSPSIDDSGSVHHYIVRRNGVEVSSETGLSFTDSTVSAGVTYRYSVVAVDRVGNASSPSAETPAATATTADVTAPEAPEEASAIAASAVSAFIAWEEAEDNVAIAGYEVLRTDGDGLPHVVASFDESAREWLDDGLQSNSTYIYDMRSFDIAGNRSELFRAGIVTTGDGSVDDVPPSTPPAFAAVALSGTAVDLTWEPATDNLGVVGYVLKRGVTVVSADIDGAVTSFGDTGLTAAVSYSYSLYARDTAGNLSAEPATLVIQLPDDVAPSAPGQLAAQATSPTRISVTWNGSSDNVGVTGYHVVANGVEVGSTPSTTLVVDAQPSTAYTLTVYAVDAAGNRSASSDPATVTTPAAEVPIARNATLTDDTYVKNGSFSGTNYGTATLMRVQGGTTVQNAYVMFNVSSTQALANVQRSVLRVYAQAAQPGVTVSRVTNTSWAEKTTTFDNAPSIGQPLATTPSIAAEGWVEIDVTSFVTGPGKYAFALTIPTTAVPKFSTKEWTSSNPSLPSESPQLVITSSNS